MRKNFKFILGGFIIRIKITKKRGRGYVPFLPKIKAILNVRSGSRISRAARLILEHINLKSFLGKNIMLFALFSGLLNPAANIVSEPEITNISLLEQPLPKDVQFQYPLAKVTINQDYLSYHPGLDLKGKEGDPVRPISAGQVIKVEQSKFGYGNSVVIDHQNNLVSRYAHLSKIYIEVGNIVETNTVIGEVGSTGRSTGPHLHLEVYKNGKTINPRKILPQP
jgi:murein DD-endopeptidase MepM/ murein hydrolase activator NlpD